MSNLELPPKQIEGRSRRVPHFDWKIHLAGLIVALGVLVYVWVFRHDISREILFAAVGLAAALVGGYAALLLNWKERDAAPPRKPRAKRSQALNRDIEPR